MKLNFAICAIHEARLLPVLVVYLVFHLQYGVCELKPTIWLLNISFTNFIILQSAPYKTTIIYLWVDGSCATGARL